MDEIKIEGSHSFDISEAIRLNSIEKAIILKEITRMSAYKIRTKKDGWVYYSTTALAEKFPYMNSNSIQRWMKELVDTNELVVTIANKVKYDKTKSYMPYHFTNIVRQNDESDVQNDESTHQNDEPIPPLSTPLSTPLSYGERKNSKILTFPEFMEQLGKQFIEVRQDEETKDCWCNGDGRVIRPAELSKLEKQYAKEYLQKPQGALTELERIVSSKKVGKAQQFGVSDVYRLFEYLNPEWERWDKIPAQRESAQILLQKSKNNIEELVNLITVAQQNKNDRFCPKIRSPYDLLQKMASLKDFMEKKQKIKSDNIFRK